MTIFVKEHQVPVVAGEAPSLKEAVTEQIHVEKANLHLHVCCAGTRRVCVENVEVIEVILHLLPRGVDKVVRIFIDLIITGWTNVACSWHSFDNLFQYLSKSYILFLLVLDVCRLLSAVQHDERLHTHINQNDLQHRMQPRLLAIASFIYMHISVRPFIEMSLLLVAGLENNQENNQGCRPRCTLGGGPGIRGVAF
jgi:hypothetical protein